LCRVMSGVQDSREDKWERGREGVKKVKNVKSSERISGQSARSGTKGRKRGGDVNAAPLFYLRDHIPRVSPPSIATNTPRPSCSNGICDGGTLALLSFGARFGTFSSAKASN